MTVPEAPFVDFRVVVEFDGTVAGWFTEVGSLTLERDVQEQGEGGVNDHVAQLPGRVSRGNITLKHGIAGEELWQWFQKGLFDGKVERRSVGLLLYQAGSETPKRWDLTGAIPVRWKGVDPGTGGNTVAVEELEFGLGPAAQGEGAEGGEIRGKGSQGSGRDGAQGHCDPCIRAPEAGAAVRARAPRTGPGLVGRVDDYSRWLYSPHRFS